MNGVLGHLFAHYRLKWYKRTSWGWRDEWDDFALQTQNSKFEPWWSEAERATFLSQRLPTIIHSYGWTAKKHFVSLKLVSSSGVQTRDLRLSKQAALTTAPLHSPKKIRNTLYWLSGQGAGHEKFILIAIHDTCQFWTARNATKICDTIAQWGLVIPLVRTLYIYIQFLVIRIQLHSKVRWEVHTDMHSWYMSILNSIRQGTQRNELTLLLVRSLSSFFEWLKC